jgi:peroxiredoxin
MPKLKPGSPAPDLSLTSVDGSEIRLSEVWRRGLTALTFYRGDFCPSCNRHLHEIEERAAAFREAGLQVLAISADRVETGRSTVGRHGLSFPVVSDPERRAIDAYDVVYNEVEGHAEPAVFLVSPDGEILYLSIASGPIGRLGAADLLAIGQGIQRKRNVAAYTAG